MCQSIILYIKWGTQITNCTVMFFADNVPLSVPEVDPLENLLIEHPSMSVYQMGCRMSGEMEEGEEELGSDEDEEDSPRSVCMPCTHTHTVYS